MKTKDIRKVAIWLVVLVVLLAASGYGARHGYRSLRQARLIKQARGYIEKAEQKKALLCLRRALGANPKDLEANRLMAKLAEANGSPEALVWRSRAVEAAPDSTDDRLALARVALSMRDLTTASNTLEAVSPTGKQTYEYQNLAGSVAITGGQVAAAEMHFKEACRLAPTNPVPQLNLAVVDLTQTNAETVALARATLERLSTDPKVNCEALRELVSFSIRTGRTNEAIAIAQRLVQQTNSVFSDKLRELDLFRAAADSQLQPHQTSLEREAVQDPAKAQAMATWLMSRTGPADALRWMDTLSPTTRTNQPISLLVADCYTALTNWPALQTTLETQQWGGLEFLRHAFLARALRGEDLASSAKTEWELALKTARGQQAALSMLLQIAAKWGWTSETEQILWTFCTQFPKEQWAPPTLAQLLYVNGRTEGLMRLYAQLNKTNPNDLAVKNNLAMVALLQDAQQVKPYDLAREVYEKSPTNATYVSTYAFSLFRQDKRADALQIIEHLTPAQLEEPTIAGYYGLFLQANGNVEKARKYLELASKIRVLPEEHKMFEQARRM